MPIIVHPEDMPHNQPGEGWEEVTLADRRTFGEPAMVARRISLQPDATGPAGIHGDTEQLLYVIEGSGIALVGDERLPLEPETMLWLEPGDQYRFKAGPAGLVILQGYTPGE